MPPLKKVRSLRDIANKVITKRIANYCVDIDERVTDDGAIMIDQRSVKALSSVLLDLPGVLLDDLIHSVIASLLRPGARQEAEDRWQSHAPAPGLHIALRLLPQVTSSELDLGLVFTGVSPRLSQENVALCRMALVVSLGRASHLTKLVLSTKACNPILEVLGRCCPRLQELYIPMSELVTDSGISHLVPGKDRPRSHVMLTRKRSKAKDWSKHVGCPCLVTIDLNKCWNVTPAGAKFLLQGLKRLNKLIYTNMKAILDSFLKGRYDGEKIERVEYFESTEYSTCCKSLNSGSTKWLCGVSRLSSVPKLFPNVTTLKMMLSDAEVKHLVEVPKLVLLELEFPDDPGPGLQHLLDHHPNVANWFHLFLEVGPLNAHHLTTIAENCTGLSYLKIIGFRIENTCQLKPSGKYFHHLTQLCLYFYGHSGLFDDSDDEEEEGPTSRHSPEMIEFFLRSDVSNLKTINIHMNVSHFLNDLYLHKLISKSNIRKLTRLGLTGPDFLPISVGTVRWIIDYLPSIQSLSVSKWQVKNCCLKVLRNEARENNFDITFN